MANMGDDSWRTQAFRQSVVAKIDKAIKQSGAPISKSSVEMENHVYVKAKSREEYLNLVARIISLVREMKNYKMTNMDDDSWRTQAFRQSVVAKIDEAIKQSGMPTPKNSVEMENHVYVKAKSREEYLGIVARLILHVREMSSKKGGNLNTEQGQGEPGMPDLINALQTLATQDTRNNQMMGMGGPQTPNMTPNTASNTS